MAAELLKEFEPEIETITLVPSDGGQYEFSINGKLLYSKLETHRHADPGEITDIVRKFIEKK
ncbi:MAG: hypothetical protein C3F13_03530 [Anaerolineales bacterium]|nr:hypothetical protein [Anaerolineae bacterium]PWB55752.1 MAG: hypothetical protein C3F13_03530 [Anaerolineales bacterium]